MSERIDWLVENLNIWTKAYDEGHPMISDAEWDSYYFELVRQELEHPEKVRNDSPTRKVIYQTVNELEKVTHNHPMLSLNKTKDKAEITKFLGHQIGIAMAKMDGLTCSLTYKHGKLVAAETRGNGEVGENILHNAVTIPSIPHTLLEDINITIDGEVICTYDDFTQFSDTYANPRNFAAGSIRLLDNKECQTRHLTFVAWDIIGSTFGTLSSKLSYLAEIGFTIVPYALIENEVDEEGAYDYIANMCQTMSYPIDGLVFKYNDCAYYEAQGRTDHHFKGGLAYKFYDEEYETTLRDIEWSMGRTGQLTPVAIFDPVDTGDSIVERASLHNLSIMKGLYDGDWVSGLKVSIFKANQIIPQVSKVEPGIEGEAKRLDCKFCPICGEPTVIKDNDGVKTLWCENPTCEGKLINQLDHYCGKKGMDIKGLSVATLEKLLDWGWIANIYEIYSLDTFRKEWIKKEGFGEKSVDKILDAIEKSRECTLDKFIAALGIPLIGNRVAKDIIKHVKTWTEFRTLVKNKFDFSEWDSFGPEKCSAIWNYNYTFADRIANAYLTIAEIEEETNTSLNGLTFVITGKLSGGSRDKYKAAIEAAGGKVASTVSSKTDYLINNDTESTSSKNVKAKELGKPIISEQEFIEMFNIKI